MVQLFHPFLFVLQVPLVRVQILQEQQVPLVQVQILQEQQVPLVPQEQTEDWKVSKLFFFGEKMKNKWKEK